MVLDLLKGEILHICVHTTHTVTVESGIAKNVQFYPGPTNLTQSILFGDGKGMFFQKHSHIQHHYLLETIYACFILL